MSKEDWRSRAAYDRAKDMKSHGIAWEFLRRNPDYRIAYGAAADQADFGTKGPAMRWGLRFPGGPEPARR